MNSTTFLLTPGVILTLSLLLFGPAAEPNSSPPFGLLRAGVGTNIQDDNNGRQSTEQLISDLKNELTKTWPKNRMIRFAFHGHSVPAGYFKTPQVRRFDAYPTLFHKALCDRYPTAVIDVCVTAVGGESSDSGAKRFAADVLVLKPDVVFIDYSLNDRRIGLKTAETAWRSMIESGLREGILVVLLTPTPDSNENLLDDVDSSLAQHSRQVRELAKEYKIPVVDSRLAFQQRVKKGESLNDFLSQSNHPNRAGHEIVTQLITKLFF